MAYTVDFKTVSTTGLESSPVAQSLAGLRANEARYIWNKFKVPYVTYPIAEKSDSFAWLQTILAERALTLRPSRWKSVTWHCPACAGSKSIIKTDLLLMSCIR